MLTAGQRTHSGDHSPIRTYKLRTYLIVLTSSQALLLPTAHKSATPPMSPKPLVSVMIYSQKLILEFQKFTDNGIELTHAKDVLRKCSVEKKDSRSV